jgi:hypothetical protein
MSNPASLSSPPRLWSQEQEQVVVAMLADGLSASVIAARFDLTRNAVIGRIARNPELHKFVRRTPGKQTATPPPKKSREKFTVIIRETRARSTVPPMRPMPLIDTGSRFCKWPIEDNEAVLGGILCCGRLVSFGAVYCGPHLEAARPKGPGR